MNKQFCPSQLPFFKVGGERLLFMPNLKVDAPIYIDKDKESLVVIKVYQLSWMLR